MGYEVITAGDNSPEKAANLLTERVNRRLIDGWEVVGGASITVNARDSGTNTFYTLCQAVKKG